MITVRRRFAFIYFIAASGVLDLGHAASFRGRGGHRALQDDPCAGKKNNQCNAPTCEWAGGDGCVPASSPPPPPPPPTPPPTPSPTNSPTDAPTSSPTVHGIGFCSNDPSETCWVTSDCACASNAASSAGIPFDRKRDRALQDDPCAGKKNNQCNAPTCEWAGGDGCVPAPSPPPPPPPTPPPTSSPTNPPTDAPTSSPTSPIPCECLGAATRSPSSSPVTSSPVTGEPTPSPTPDPTPSPVTNSPTESPTTSPTVSPTNSPTETFYCGCPECTQAVWDHVACMGSECYPCGSRIDFLQSTGQTYEEACTNVSNEFPNNECGPYCDPTVCNDTTSPTSAPTMSSPVTDAPTSSPTPEPTPSPFTSAPTKSPSNITPPPTPSPTTSPTETFYCGCPECTQSVWDYVACNGSECYPCGSRINYLQSIGQTYEEACTNVSNEFPNNECGPMCNSLTCNPEFLDEPDPSKLIWQDEFDVDGSPDSSKWDYDIGDGCPDLCGWGNGEEQTYTNNPENVWVSGGILRISAKRQTSPPGYTSTRMVSRGKQAFRYGRIRFRASLANCQGVGTWPALWMLPEYWEYGGWPDSGEIDVMEAVGYEGDKFHGTVHTGAYNHAIGTQKGGSIVGDKDQWHIFEIDWQLDKIRFAMDSQVYYVFTPEDVNNFMQWPFNKDFHLLLNIAVGGSWGGLQGVDASAFEGDGQIMEVDWVRVYSI